MPYDSAVPGHPRPERPPPAARHPRRGHTGPGRGRQPAKASPVGAPDGQVKSNQGGRWAHDPIPGADVEVHYVGDVPFEDDWFEVEPAEDEQAYDHFEALYGRERFQAMRLAAHRSNLGVLARFMNRTTRPRGSSPLRRCPTTRRGSTRRARNTHRARGSRGDPSELALARSQRPLTRGRS